jgi:hypothetical protein
MMLAGAPNRKRRRVGDASASLQQYAADLFETQLDDVKPDAVIWSMINITLISSSYATV